MAVIGEYRFVFVDETETTKKSSNSSLSSTVEQKAETERRVETQPVKPQSQDSMKKFAGVAGKSIAYGAAGARIYQTIRNMSYNAKSTSATIGGNLQAARHLNAKKAKQDMYINRGLKIGGYGLAGLTTGMAFGGPIGAAVMGLVGLTTGVVTEVATMNNQYKQEMREFMSDLQEQKYSGYIESRRLINIGGGVR